MDKIIKAVILDGMARVTAIETTEAVNESIRLHGMSPVSAAALGRTLTAGAYLGTNLKGKGSTFSLTVSGSGELGKIIVAGDSDGHIRGYVENPSLDLPLRLSDGKLDVGRAVGATGDLTVVKDFGLKEPYVGRSELVSGEIAEDFATYLLRSEGIPSAVALGVLVDKSGCKASGGVIVEALPDADENAFVILEDIFRDFSNVSSVIAEKGLENLVDFYFGHLHAEVFPTLPLKLKCNCSKRKIDGIVKGLGKEEAKSILEEYGKLEVNCEFCGKTYAYGKRELDKLFS